MADQITPKMGKTKSKAQKSAHEICNFAISFMHKRLMLLLPQTLKINCAENIHQQSKDSSNLRL